MTGSRVSEPGKLPRTKRPDSFPHLWPGSTEKPIGVRPLLALSSPRSGNRENRVGQAEEGPHGGTTVARESSPGGYLVPRAGRRVRQTVFTRLGRLELINVGQGARAPRGLAKASRREN